MAIWQWQPDTISWPPDKLRSTFLIGLPPVTYVLFLAATLALSSAQAAPPGDDAAALSPSPSTLPSTLPSSPVAPDDAEPMSLTDILAAEGVPDASSDLSVDVDRWVLHDVLRDGFAQTPSWESTLPDASARPLALVPASTWLEGVEARRLALRLSGQPPDHHLKLALLNFDIPLANHPLVDVYIDYFTGRGRFFFEKWLARAPRYIPLMQKILAAKGVPKDLVYLAMIESGFSAKAFSSAAASGYWQFIGSTGRVFGLTHDIWVDERRDFIRATEAAADYLSQLYKETGDWHLAWASYNAGEGRVRRALEKYGSTDFWSLIEHKNSLAKETMHYVPKIIAAAIVAKDAERYGFNNLHALQPFQYDEIVVKEATDLRFVANQTHVSLDTLRDLNPALLHDVTPPGRKMTLRVPTGQGPAVAALLDGLPLQKRLTYEHHTVRRGDTLAGISRRYNANVEAIKEFNNLRDRRALRLGEELIVPAIKIDKRQEARVVASHVTASRKATRRDKLATQKSRARHVVASGDTLWSIARRYGVSVARIKNQNARRGSHITIGDVLEISRDL